MMWADEINKFQTLDFENKALWYWLDAGSHVTTPVLTNHSVLIIEIVVYTHREHAHVLVLVFIR